MICFNCKQEIEEGSVFCPFCGKKQEFVVSESNTQLTENETPLADSTGTTIQSEPQVQDTTFENNQNRNQTVPENNGIEEVRQNDSPLSGKRSKLNIPKYVYVIAGCAFAVVLLLIVILNGGKADYIKQTDSVFPFGDDYNDELVICGQDGVLYKQTFDDWFDAYSTSLSGEAAVAISEDSTLWVYADKKYTAVAYDVDDDYGYQYSSDATTLIYFNETDYVDGYEIGKLYRYSKGKSELIASDVVFGCYCISPDGSAIGYTCYDEDDEKFVGYYWNGKTHEFGRNRFIFALSSKANYIYYSKLKDEDSWYSGLISYVQKGNNDNSRVKLAEGNNVDFLFNCDATEVIVACDEGSFISVKAKEREKISKEKLSYSLRFLSPTDAADGLACSMLTPYKKVVNQVRAPYTSLLNMMFYDAQSGEITLLDEKAGAMVVVKNANYCLGLSEDRRTLVYVKGDVLYRVNVDTNANPEAIMDLDEEEVIEIYMTDDLNGVYYINSDYDLFYMQVGKKPERILTDINYKLLSDSSLSIEGIRLFETDLLLEGNKLVVPKDGYLYLCDGKKAKKVFNYEMEDGEIDGIYNGRFLSLVIIDYDDYYDCYYTSDGKNFELLCQAY